MPGRLIGHTQAAPQSYPFLVLAGIPLVFAVATVIVKTCGDRLTGSQRRTHDMSRSPIMQDGRPQAEPRMAEHKWWQFWRWGESPKESDVEQCVPEPPQPQPQPQPQSTLQTASSAQSDDLSDVRSDLLSDVLSFIETYGTPSTFADFDGTPQPAVLTSVLSARGSQTRQAPIRPPRPSERARALLDVPSDPQLFTPGNPASFAYKYTLIRSLASSSEGSIHLVADSTDKKFIIKQVETQKNSQGQWIIPNEARILNRWLPNQHPNIINIVDELADDTLPDQPMVSMVTDFCNGGDLQRLISHLQLTGQKAPRALILHFISSMIDALGYLHFGDLAYHQYSDTTSSITHPEGPVLHRDIKPANIFMKWTENSLDLPEIVLADFGHATPEKYERGIYFGTPGYSPPELAIAARDPNVDRHNVKGIWSKASDMFSFGVTLHALIAADHRPDTSDVEAHFANSTVSDMPLILGVLKSCLDVDPGFRPQAWHLYPISSMCKREIDEWYDQGGSIDKTFWPPSVHSAPVSAHPTSGYSSHYSQPSAASPSSVTVPGQQFHQIRRVQAQTDLAACAASNSSSSFVSQPRTLPSLAIPAEPASAHGTVVREHSGVFLRLPIPTADDVPESAFSWDSTDSSDADSWDGISDATSDFMDDTSIYPGA